MFFLKTLHSHLIQATFTVYDWHILYFLKKALRCAVCFALLTSLHYNLLSIATVLHCHKLLHVYTYSNKFQKDGFETYTHTQKHIGEVAAANDLC